MIPKILITLCFVLCFYGEVHAEQEVKRGAFPFMAFIYYPDDTVVDDTGARYLRGAVLIRVDWLVSSAVGPIITDEPTGFPRKTLVARAGAISIDANFNLNEDEDEQEREIIEIVRPYNHSNAQWYNDISLLKTLLPFTLTSAVGFTSLVNRHGNVDKTCTILVYSPREINGTVERYLMQMFVDLLPSSVNNCGEHFVQGKMICASDSDDNKYAYSPNFCQGNSGGPLVCDGDVTGIQIYINNECKEPHLYQLLSAWENLITCGTEETCFEKECSEICDVVNKDDATAIRRPTMTTKYKMKEISDTIEVTDTSTTTTTYGEDNSHSLTPTLTSTAPNESNDRITIIEVTTADPVTVELSTADLSIVEQSTSEGTSSEHITVEALKQYSDQTTIKGQPVSNEILKENTLEDEIIGKKWPNEKSAERRRAMENDTETSAINPKIEAREDTVTGSKRDDAGNAVRICLSYSSIVGYIILSCLI